jgi:NAD(P)-dependent dehydrogenase (short-subunit alcohol dehydrogenase family)
MAICDVDTAALEQTASDATDAGAEVLASALDVRDVDAMEGFFSEIDARFGGPDVLVNVVGGTFRTAFTELSAKGRDALVRTNFTWVVDATQRAARRMADQGRGGSIIMLTSIEAHRAAPGFAVYAAMKAALAHLARTLAVELGPAGIRVNCIAPDFVPTAGLGAIATTVGSGERRAAESGEGEADLGDRLTIPLGRKGRPDDVGSCVLFLASELSAYITGTTLHPDGGAWAASGWWDWPDEGFVTRPPAWVLDEISGRSPTR